MTGRVLLTTLSARTSGKGRPYLSGCLGKARVVALEGDADRFGNPTWDIFLAEPEARDSAPAGRQRPPRGDAGSASAMAPTTTGARPGSRYTAPRPESARARQDRVAGEVLAEQGVTDGAFSDPIPL